MTQTAERVYSAAETTMGDTMTLVLNAVHSFGEDARDLSEALRSFEYSANALTAGLDRLPDQ
jgi:hypothetical protein